MKRVAILFIFLLLPLIAGCKTELYSNLDESDANRMMGVLLSRGVQADKLPAKDNRWVLRVEEKQISKALEILQLEGLPRAKYENMGQIFQKTGLVSSPLEERVRYIYALSQDLADTISFIDGVMVAKVHVVLPENDPFSDKKQPSSASVFIKCRNASVVNANIPNIKKLVINSIEGLSYDKVTVVPFVSMQAAVPGDQVKWINFMGIEVETSSKIYLIILTVLAGLSLAGLIFTLVWFYIYPRFFKKEQEV